MSHYAELDENNIVLRVVVGNPELNDDAGLDYITELLGGRWLRTSYNSRIRGNYAGVGYTYFVDADIFMPTKCHPEASLNIKKATWDCSNEEHNVQPTN
jgi:hypothetical protein